MAEKSLVAVKLKVDRWAGKEDTFIGGNPVAEEERVLAGMDVEMPQKIAFGLVNTGIVTLLVPSD
jgi:hypothetical protein